MSYCISVPIHILERYQDLNLEIQTELPYALSRGLRDMERTLQTPQEEEFQIYQYDKLVGRQKLWRGSTQHQIKKITAHIEPNLVQRTLDLIKHCSLNEIDLRQLYWIALIQPHIQKGTGQLYKQQLQSNQLMPILPSTIISFCLWSRLLRMEKLDKDQKLLEVK